jgi:hypothetical protein
LILFADDALARELWVNALLEQMKRLKIPTQTQPSTRPDAKGADKANDDMVFPTGPMPDWDGRQVANWLKLKGYYSMVPMFQENQITGSFPFHDFHNHQPQSVVVHAMISFCWCQIFILVHQSVYRPGG